MGSPESQLELDQAIAENAAGPAKASVDGQSVEAQPLRDQVEADRYLESKKASRRGGLGIRLARLIAPGTSDRGAR